ncbi:MAG TPA: molybdopterin-synthase adenylyltransferase MoeB [Elusimicrobiota bacterium]|jgi:adenylyltransferase/sulfurtransferase|nr:molybdopterin-synthase adenylyltransferase MoeB [Elusimicrobiota bacterium]
MSVEIRLPTALRVFADKQDKILVEAATVGDALNALFGRHDRLKAQLLGPDGKLRSFVNVYVNEDDARDKQGLGTPVKDGDTVLIVPAIAGGVTLAESRGEAELDKAELIRYNRHIILPEVGLEGQKKLKNSAVLCVGAGGLGSPLALYLAAAGVGRIGIVDFDVVDASNLQRQIIHDTPSIGTPKLASAKNRLRALNPHIEVETHEVRLSAANAVELFKNYDVIADGTDNFPTRYLVNDVCVLTGKPNAYGSIFRFEGQLSVFAAKDGPCYRCLYPEPPPPGLVPSCAEGGVLGVLPGVIGTMQAIETIKLLLGIGRPLVGRLMLYDALEQSWRTLKVKKNPACPVCGENPTIKAPIDYEAFCGLKEKPTNMIPEITVEELKAKLDKKEKFVLLDVREPHEYEIAKIPGSKLIPLGELDKRVGELDKSSKLIVHCKMGGRSARAVTFLRAQGFDATNVAGGIHDWSERIDPSVPTY